MDIVMLRASGAYSVLPRMADALADGFAALDVAVAVPELTADTVESTITDTLAAHPGAWVIAFGSIAAELAAADGRSIYDAAGCGFVGWDVDHPVYKFERFRAPIARRLQVCACASHLEFARRVIGMEASGLPLLPGVAAVDTAPRPLAERPIFAIAAMSWLGEPEVWWREMKGQPVYDLVEGMVGRLLADPAVDLMAAYDATCADRAIQVRFDEAVCWMMSRVARFVRAYDRLRLADAFAALDVPRVLCGKGWDGRLGERPNLHFIDDLDVSDLAELYGQSRVVLNFNASNGASERAMMALAGGSLAVSDNGPLLEAQLGPSGALSVFDRRRPEALADTLLGALGHPSAQDAADQGRGLVAERHLWRHKAQQLVERLAQADSAAPALAA